MHKPYQRLFIPLLLLLLLLSGCGSGNQTSPHDQSGDQGQKVGQNQDQPGKENPPFSDSSLSLLPPPSLSAEILTKEKNQIHDWLSEVDIWRYKAVPKQFKKEDEQAIRTHLERVYPKEMVDAYLQNFFSFDEKNGVYTMLDTDFHPDIKAWEDPYTLEIQKNDKTHEVRIVLSGETVYDQDRESRVGFNFLQQDGNLKILRFKYSIVDQLSVETPQNQEEPVVNLPLPSEWEAIPEILIDGEESFTHYTLIDREGKRIGEFTQVGRNDDFPEGYLPNHLVNEKKKPIETKLGAGWLYELVVDLPKEKRTDQNKTYEMVYLLIPIKDKEVSYLFSVDVPIGESIQLYVKKVVEIFKR